MYTKEEIVTAAKELGKMIAETDEVKFFEKAEAKIHENKDVREKMASLRSLQQQSVNFQSYGKEKAHQLAEKKIAVLEEELDNMPIVNQFMDAQDDVNSILQMVSHAISSTVTHEIIERTGGDHLEGETGAAMANRPSKDVK
ncbi:RicAFT regulatory complex protein RicA family protein [Phocicoccus pinnipedialis]|uniref:Cell fate regulator YmcA, YheA/YmcA/DUF963 family (Controls sporulation, competence, biofilm development) n=1 Tax=Phocicoccus pinnipedialis TaxID=110845 RepID=A0A6V7RGD0_9BACL|nr:YlbF family regulator [Jeotgalicoccus pinnipedialis]MBP1939143.1 cell fate (sporulation/competence/biofilm development) regulator YmcA (YheA/YmcA/DUF963 family) [Jeotgalicoccus pinnipedialis]CAD2076607.1 putative protein YmcA [Jeotgalicoccus pinnipedialis]